MNRLGDDILLVLFKWNVLVVFLLFLRIGLLIGVVVFLIGSGLNRFGDNVVIVLLLIINDWMMGWYKVLGIGMIIVIVLVFLVFIILLKLEGKLEDKFVGKFKVNEYVMNVFFMLLVV